MCMYIWLTREIQQTPRVEPWPIQDAVLCLGFCARISTILGSTHIGRVNPSEVNPSRVGREIQLFGLI